MSIYLSKEVVAGYWKRNLLELLYLLSRDFDFDIRLLETSLLLYRIFPSKLPNELALGMFKFCFGSQIYLILSEFISLRISSCLF
jgi:hypothetical protein